MNQKPTLINVIAAMTLASGIINLFWGYVGSATALGTIIGIVCVPITILPTILGVFEVIYAAKLLSNQPVKPSPSIAWFQISMVLYGNIFSMIVGILNLIFFNDQSVRTYFAQSHAAQPAAPAMPVVEAPAVPEIEAPAPESPEKPKRGRKSPGG